MNRVITINLNGNAYQVDERGHDALRDYLDGADILLEGNPDRAEIIADLEQAIADKCRAYLGAHKTVVTAAEIEQIIKEMGPVNDPQFDSDDEQPDGQPHTGKGTTGTRPPRRLYQIREGSMLSGVCKGLAVYFNIDVTIIRIVFIVLTLLTSGVWLLLYAAMMIVVPHADTAEERAAAHGTPFNAKEVIDQAKKNYESFRNNKEWKKQWRYMKREWRRTWKQSTTTSSVVSGFIALAFVLAILITVFSFVRLGGISAWPRGIGFPGLLGILFLVFVIRIVTLPFSLAFRAPYYGPGPYYVRSSPWAGMLRLFSMAFFFWLAYELIPQVHYIVNNLPEIIDGILR
jgi:phage shock protein PspC (stress-responsive transcriptional regulator)